MNNLSSFDILIIIALALVGILLVVRSRSRVALDVLEDLKEISQDSLDNNEIAKQALFRSNFAIGQYNSSGLELISSRQDFKHIRSKVVPLFFALLALFIRLLISPSTPQVSILACLIGLALGHLYERTRLAKLQRDHRQAIDFYLPLIMERLVMAVQAGLDILPAIRSVTELEVDFQEEDQTEKFFVNTKLDPVSCLLKLVLSLSESGISFEKSLEEVSTRLNSPSIKHAFMHLSVAHKEGGELILPLRELSDATQLYYQESIEEEIAGMPVKATMPLLCTFAGLIVCFLTSPIIQVMGIMSRSMVK